MVCLAKFGLFGREMMKVSEILRGLALFVPGVCLANGGGYELGGEYGNFEGSVDAGGVRPDVRFPQLVRPGSVAELLRGIDCVSLANNHANDGGPQGLAALCRELDQAGIRYVGVGSDPAVLEKNGVRVAVWGSCGSVPGNLAEWQEKADQLVVMVHQGEEMQDTPNGEQRDLARRLAAAGVDLVFGSHPHVWQRPFHEGLTRVYPSLGNWRFKPAPGVPSFNERPWVVLPLGVRHARGMEQLSLPRHGERGEQPAAGRAAVRVDAR